MAKKKKNPDIDIKIRGVDKWIKKAEKDKKIKCYSWQGSCGGGFWGFGSALAMILSYTRSESILWTILHGILSWFYILFRAMQTWGWF